MPELDSETPDPDDSGGRVSPHAAALASLAEMIAARGPDRFLARRLDLLIPSEQWFPEPWEPTLVGAGRLLHRLLHYAGLGQRRFTILDNRPPLDRLANPVPTVNFVDVVDGRLVFALEQLGAGPELLACLAHEVALASVVLAADDADPYRKRSAAVPEVTGLEQHEAEAGEAATYLGFAVLELMTPSALFTDLPSYLLALQIVAIDPARSREALAELAPHLTPVHRQQVAAWIDQMLPDADRIREWLGLPDVEAWPAPRAWELGPKLDAETEATLVAAEDAYRNPKRGQTVPRLTETRTASYGFVAALIGVVPTFVMIAIEPSWLCTLPPVLFALVGAVIGSRKLLEHCGGCGRMIDEPDSICRTCGATLGERVPLRSSGASGAKEADDDDDDEEDEDED